MSVPVWTTRSSDLGVIPELQYFQFTLEAADQDDASSPINFELIAGEPPVGIRVDGSGILQGNPDTIVKIAGVPQNVAQSTTSKFTVRARSAERYATFVGDGSTTVFVMPVVVNFEIFKIMALAGGEIQSASYVKEGETVTVTVSRAIQSGQVLTVGLYKSEGAVSDRTFTITVVGQNPPEILKFDPLGTFIDTDFVDIDIEAIDLDNEPLTWNLISGRLPPGLLLNAATGKISGYIRPLPPSIKDLFTTYTFSISVTDGKNIDTETYNIRVINIRNLTADSIQILVDAGVIDASRSTIYSPIVLTPAGEIGPFTHDNYFLFKFDAVDFNRDEINYIVDLGQGIGFDNIASGFDEYAFDLTGDFGLPPGLTLDPDTGWLYGYIPFQSEFSVTYKFYIRAYKTSVFYESPDELSVQQYISRRVLYQLTVRGVEQTDLTWITPENLGEIDNGAASELQIQAVTNPQRELHYELLTGSKSKLPPGLKLLDNGLIVGRTTFSVFSLDGGRTTFDKTSFTVDSETTFDETFSFTVRVFDDFNTVNATKRFTLKINKTSSVPFENLYMLALLSEPQRQLLNDFLQNSDFLHSDEIYRLQDSNFGISENLKLLIANGVRPVEANFYAEAMQRAHYTKPLYFGDIKSAQVLNREGTVRYEVLYVEIRDQLRNSKGEDVSSEVDVTHSNVGIELNTPPYPGGDGNINPNTNKFISAYPNNLANMRRQLNRSLGQVSKKLPEWMVSKQQTGRSLGYVTACVLAYVMPGTSEKIIYRMKNYGVSEDSSSINLAPGFDFKTLSFTADRYVWDNFHSQNFNKSTQRFLTEPETTFDVYIQRLTTNPLDYRTNPNGLPNIGPDRKPKSTKFDGGSMRFIPFRDQYNDLDLRGEFLKFPQNNILR
jgi:hypothetical protein